MRIIISGSRAFTDYATLCETVNAAGMAVTEVVSGGSHGVDAMAERWAAENGLPLKRFPAEWEKYGRSAVPKRNQQMAEYGEALIALCDGGGRSTTKMISAARKRGLRVFVRRVTHVAEGSAEGRGAPRPRELQRREGPGDRSEALRRTARHQG